MRRFFIVGMSFILLGFFSSYAQTARGGGESGCQVWGQIVSPGRVMYNNLNIELAGKGAPPQQAPLENGNFTFRSVPAGAYQFRVLDESGHVLFKRTKVLSGREGKVILVAPPNRAPVQSFANTISFRELGNPRSREARKALQASEKAMDAGQTEKSIKYLQKALAINPQLAEAHINLAAQYAQLGRDEQALEHFQAAVDLGPAFPEASYDFAMLLLLTRHYPQAEAAARRVLGEQEGLPGLHAVLAASLLWQQRNLDEAYEHLRLAAPIFPIARLLAANALAVARHFSAAAAQVREYLRTGAHPCERRELEGWLARMDAPHAAFLESQDRAPSRRDPSTLPSGRGTETIRPATPVVEPVPDGSTF